MDTEKCDGMRQCQKDKAIREAQRAAVREHQWEHKVGAVVTQVYPIAGPQRTFTREEIDNHLRQIAVGTAWVGDEKERTAIRNLLTSLRQYFTEVK